MTKRKSNCAKLAKRIQEIVDIITTSYKTVCFTNGTIVVSVNFDRESNRVTFDAAYSKDSLFNPVEIHSILLTTNQAMLVPSAMNMICKKSNNYSKYYEEKQLVAIDLYFEDWEEE